MSTCLSLQEKIAELSLLLGSDMPYDMPVVEPPSLLKEVPTRLDYHTTAPVDLLNAELDSGTKRNSTGTSDCRNEITSVL